MSSSQGASAGTLPIHSAVTSPAVTDHGGVRRHHTISSASRSARVAPRHTSDDDQGNDQDLWKDDEVVDQDWVGGVGAVGEKSLLHRQSSLPTKYHRALPGHTAKHSGNLTPKSMNSLSAIAGHEGDEEDWEREMRGLRNEDEEHHITSSEHPQQHQLREGRSPNPSPLSPHFGAPPVPSPPPADSGIRRHTSLTYGAAARKQQTVTAGLKRSGTLQNKQARGQHTPSPPNAEEEEYPEDTQEYPYDEDYFALAAAAAQQAQQQSQGQYSTQINRTSPWTTPGLPSNPGFLTSSGVVSNATIDDVTRALSAVDLANSSQGGYRHNNGSGNYSGAQTVQPPRFNPTQTSPQLASGERTPNGGSQKLQLMTDMDGRRTPILQSGHGSAVFVGNQQQQYSQRGDERLQNWDQPERSIHQRSSGSNLNYMFMQGQVKPGTGGIPSVPAIPPQYLNQTQQGAPRLGMTPPYVQGQAPGQGGAQNSNIMTSPLDVPSLVAAKGYNPTNFDTRPSFARYFVIKSYTEDDVHKSLKYEIWSSTDPGNKRLDKAFKECAGRGPIYLFFSVNASGHFCGMAEMLTPVDYTRSSTVWASDKWKGVFKVRWIFVRDIPNANLRHIRLNNTQERKPVTNSRDTQELLPEAGQEMLRIFHTHPARTSLLQDFAFYELQAIQKSKGQQAPSSPQSNQASLSPQGTLSPPNQPQQTPYAIGNPYGGAVQMSQMTPMMQMQMQMNMGMGNQFGVPQPQVMQQSVMRHPSPGPPSAVPSGNSGFMRLGGASAF